MKNNENFKLCKAIAMELEKIHAGGLFQCPDCGELVQEGECRCGAAINEETAEPASLFDYFSDALDIEYRCGNNKEYRNVRIMVTCGGPNIYVDTGSKAVELYWWTETAQCSIDPDVCNEIDSIFEEYFNCL